MAWIETVPDDTREGPIGRTYAAAVKRAGRVFGIVRLMSLQPEILDASMALYQATTTSARSPLPRWFRELVAVRVSRLNDCFY